MGSGFLSELARRNRHNLRTLRQSPAAEISGALGDLGTLLPLMIALALQGSINLSSTLIFTGLFNIITGVVFGIPLPVQPMKAIAAAALATPLPLEVVTASGALVSLAVLLLSTTGLLRLLTRHIPVPIIKGIQLGAALRLVTSGANLILPLSWFSPILNSRLSTTILFLALFLTQRSSQKYFPYALILFILGLCTSLSITTPMLTPHLTPTEPAPTPNWKDITPSLLHLPSFTSPLAWSTALSQLPLTTLNSVLAVSALAAELFPHPITTTTTTTTTAAVSDPTTTDPANTNTRPYSVTSLGLSVSMMNLAGCWFGAMPVCHGAGGLAAQYRFGGRSGACVVLLGVLKMGVGVVCFFGGGGSGGDDGVMGVLGRFPRGVLGVMVVAAGLELSKAGAGLSQTERGVVGVGELQERWVVMMVTAAGTLAFGNDAVGFVAGCCCHGAYKVADWGERRWARGVAGERRPLLR